MATTVAVEAPGVSIQKYSIKAIVLQSIADSAPTYSPPYGILGSFDDSVCRTAPRSSSAASKTLKATHTHSVYTILCHRQLANPWQLGRPLVLYMTQYHYRQWTCFTFSPPEPCPRIYSPPRATCDPGAGRMAYEDILSSHASLTNLTAHIQSAQDREAPI